MVLRLYHRDPCFHLVVRNVIGGGKLQLPSCLVVKSSYPGYLVGMDFFLLPPFPFFLPLTLRGVTNKVALRRCQPLSSSFLLLLLSLLDCQLKLVAQIDGM